MFKLKLILLALLVINGLYLTSIESTLAQEPDDSPSSADVETPATEPVITTTQTSLTGETGITATQTLTANAQTIDLTWTQLDYTDRKISNARPSVEFAFNLPGDVVPVPGSYTRLMVSHTGAQVGKPAALTIDLNDTTLGIVQLTTENDNRGQIQLDILPEQLRLGANQLKVTVAAGDSCLTPDLPVEVVVHSDGLIHLAYQIVTRQPDLTLYPAPFFERGFEPSVVYLVLPDSPTPADMTVATTISAGLGRYSRGSIQVKSVTVTELTSGIQSNYNLIMLGSPEANSLLAQLPLPLSLPRADTAPDDGILQEIISPWNSQRMVLVVSGQTDEAVYKAGAALNRQILFPSLKGQIAVIKALLDIPVEESTTADTDLTLEDLGYVDRVVYGSRASSQRFNFSMPNSWQILDEPSLALYFTHSEVLSNAVSTLDIQLNGVPIGSTLLDSSNAKDGLLKVQLPSWLLKGGNNAIEVFIDMAIPGGDECETATSAQAWTVLSRSSTLYLPYQAQPSELNLANLLRPFSDDLNLSNTYIALAETPSQTERDALLNLAVQLGAAVRGTYVALQAGWAAEISPEIKQTHHIITVGQPGLNPFISEINDLLPQPFLSGSNEPSQIHNPAIITFDPSRSIGFVQLLVSPWNVDRAILVITGTDSSGVAAAFDLMVNSLTRLKGNLAMIEGDNLVTVDTRPLIANKQIDAELRSTRPDAAVREAQAERWW